MNKEKRRAPKLRFPGFTEDWEQRKLDDIAKIKTGGGTPKTANPEYWSGNIPWIQSSDLVEGDIVHVNINKFINNNALKNSAAKLISRDSIALVTRVGVGKVAVINQDFTTSQDFLSLSDFDGSDIKFLAYQLYRLMQENAKVLQGTSIKGITKTELIEQSISIPSSSQEQNLISNVLSKIDSIITLHQRKLEHLNLKKKALLQKLFPKNGARYPELRFPGFTDAWEQRKFGELFILKSGVAFKLSEYTKTGIPIINGESIKAGKISLEKVNYLPNEYQYKYQECLLFPGDIVLGLNRPIIDGELKISRIPSDIKTSLLYQRAGKIIFKVNMEENFTYQLLSKEVLTFTRREAVGSDQPFITTTKLNKWDLCLPVKDEERRMIGNLLDNINNIITLHQRKLEHLKLQKKALLQQLLV